MKTFLYWTPCVLTILFTAFISLFSFDIFDVGYTFGETLLALLMHLIPTFSWQTKPIEAIIQRAPGLDMRPRSL